MAKLPTLNNTRVRLEEVFVAGWAGRTPISFDNVRFDGSTIESYVEIKFINYTTENATIGSGLTKRKRHTGVLAVKVFAKQNTGAGTAYSYADDVAAIMDNLLEVNLFTYSSEARRVGEEEGGRYVLIVDVPYISDEV